MDHSICIPVGGIYIQFRLREKGLNEKKCPEK